MAGKQATEINPLEQIEVDIAALHAQITEHEANLKSSAAERDRLEFDQREIRSKRKQIWPGVDGELSRGSLHLIAQWEADDLRHDQRVAELTHAIFVARRESQHLWANVHELLLQHHALKLAAEAAIDPGDTIERVQATGVVVFELTAKLEDIDRRQADAEADFNAEEFAALSTQRQEIAVALAGAQGRQFEARLAHLKHQATLFAAEQAAADVQYGHASHAANAAVQARDTAFAVSANSREALSEVNRKIRALEKQRPQFTAALANAGSR